MTIEMAARPLNKSAEALVVALAGALSLSVAMGIGRFAFTPLLPMMLHDGVIDLHGGSTLATANYLGYLMGAVLCAMLPALSRRLGRAMPDSARMVRLALVMTGVLTLAMAWQVVALWPVWRFASGVISAVAFVYTSAWCLARLVALQSGHLGGVIYTGPGVGIALSGFAVFGMTASDASWELGWLVFGISALVLTAFVWSVFTPRATMASSTATSSPAAPHAVSRLTLEEVLLILAYGLAGFGYIVTATFLPVIARSALPGSGWVDLFWPLFGIAVAIGALLSRFVPLTMDRRLLLAICYAMQGMGVLVSLLVPDVTGFIASSVLLGLPFTTLTLFAMQEVRRLRPGEATGFIGLMTVCYSIGQIAGPPMVSAILARASSPADGFALSLEIAAGSLFLGALIFGFMKLRFALTDM